MSDEAERLKEKREGRSLEKAGESIERFIERDDWTEGKTGRRRGKNTKQTG